MGVWAKPDIETEWIPAFAGMTKVLVHGFIQKIQATSHAVMPGLDPGIHMTAVPLFPLSLLRTDVDGRVKPGHDGKGDKVNLLLASVH